MSKIWIIHRYVHPNLKALRYSLSEGVRTSRNDLINFIIHCHHKPQLILIATKAILLLLFAGICYYSEMGKQARAVSNREHEHCALNISVALACFHALQVGKRRLEMTLLM